MTRMSSTRAVSAKTWHDRPPPASAYRWSERLFVRIVLATHGRDARCLLTGRRMDARPNEGVTA